MNVIANGLLVYHRLYVCFQQMKIKITVILVPI